MEITPEIAIEHIDKFKPYYDPKTGKRSKDIPTDKNITVWVAREEGFMIDDLNENLGLDALVATSWIEHDELVKLCKS